MNRRTTAFSTLMLTLLFVALPGYLIYARWTRARLLPSALRYLPPETNVLVGVGDIASLWDGIEFHFGRVIRETGRKGALATKLAELGKDLEDKKLWVKKKEDLVCRYGIDIDRGILAGLSLQGPAFTAVIPVASDKAVVDKYCPHPGHQTSEEKMLGFFCASCSAGSGPILLRHQGKEASDPCSPSILLAGVRTDRSWVLEDHAYDLGGQWLVFPRPDTAILSSSCQFLKRGLAEQERNLAYARADDALFEAVRYQLRRPLLSGPGAVVYVRGGLATDFAPVGTAAAAVNLVPDAVVGDLRLRTAGIKARIVDELLAPPGRERPWREFFGTDDTAVLVLRDDSMRRYIDFAGNVPGFDAVLKKFLGGILEPARRLDHLDQIVLGGTDYRDGVPLLVLGIWGSREELAQMVLETQRRLRQTRDEKLLEGARLKGAELKSNPRNPLAPVDFNGREYVEADGGNKIRYLEPRITEDDLTYRLSEVVDPDEKRVLLENRFRLASTITGDILWVSTGKQPLLRMLGRLGGAKAPLGFPLGAESDGHGNKLRVLASATALIRTGMLSGESELQKITEQVLLDFRYHREIIVSLKPTGNGQEIRMDFVAHGPASASLPPVPASKLSEAPR